MTADTAHPCPAALTDYAARDAADHAAIGQHFAEVRRLTDRLGGPPAAAVDRLGALWQRADADEPVWLALTTIASRGEVDAKYGDPYMTLPADLDSAVAAIIDLLGAIYTSEMEAAEYGLADELRYAVSYATVGRMEAACARLGEHLAAFKAMAAGAAR